jgi:hypothetical protein
MCRGFAPATSSRLDLAEQRNGNPAPGAVHVHADAWHKHRDQRDDRRHQADARDALKRLGIPALTEQKRRAAD